MADSWTADGWCDRGPASLTADGWPELNDSWTADGWFEPRPAGGYGGGFETAYERQLHRRRLEREREERAAEEAAEAAQGDAVQTELAKLLHGQLAKQAKHDDLMRLKRIVQRQSLDRTLPDKVQKAFELAKTEASFSRLMALEREYLKMQEEEELALLMTLSLLD